MKNVAKIIKARGGLRALAGFPVGTGKAIRVESEGFMDLHIECIGESPHGEGMVLVSVAHYGEQNGDLMRGEGSGSRRQGSNAGADQGIASPTTRPWNTCSLTFPRMLRTSCFKLLVFGSIPAAIAAN